jgi:hypothetical protein
VPPVAVAAKFAEGVYLRARPQPADGWQRCGDVNTGLTELVVTIGAATVIGSSGPGPRAGPRQLGTTAAGQAGSPRRVALVEPHAASTSLLSQRPAHPTHRPGRARPFPAPAGCSWGPKRPPGPASGLPVGCLLLQRCLLLELYLPALSAQALATASDGFVHDRPRNHNVNQGRGGSQKMALCRCWRRQLRKAAAPLTSQAPVTLAAAPISHVFTCKAPGARRHVSLFGLLYLATHRIMRSSPSIREDARGAYGHACHSQPRRRACCARWHGT